MRPGVLASSPTRRGGAVHCSCCLLRVTRSSFDRCMTRCYRAALGRLPARFGGAKVPGAFKLLSSHHLTHAPHVPVGSLVHGKVLMLVCQIKWQAISCVSATPGFDCSITVTTRLLARSLTTSAGQRTTRRVRWRFFCCNFRFGSVASKPPLPPQGSLSRHASGNCVLGRGHLTINVAWMSVAQPNVNTCDAHHTSIL